MARGRRGAGKGYSHPGYGLGERFPRPAKHRAIRGGGKSRGRRSKRY